MDYENLETEFEALGFVTGVDEAGRGPLAGNVVASAVILDPDNPIQGLADSKKISEKKRESLYKEILEKALCYSIQIASPAEIDRLNILHASMLAMQRAVNSLDIKPAYALIDGNRIPESLNCPASAIVKGDARVKAISAASILAKVTRDREMQDADQLYPQYGFAKHKGYPTKMHMDAIQQFGITPLHRRSFKPVRDVAEQQPEQVRLI